MTKYILVGGYPWKASDNGKAFIDELVKGFEEPVKMLECLFARSQEGWQKAYTADEEIFTKHLQGKKFELQLANPERFIEQLRWANAMYIRGGETEPLMETLAQYPGWEKEFEGKTLAGSSAGAMVMAKYAYNIDSLKISEGLGLVPVKVQVHYRSDYNAPNVDWDKADEELKNYKEDLPVLNLGEGEFEVIEQ
jgi:peptidase E